MGNDRVSARNGARASKNLIHDDDGARANGYRMALVPGGTVYAYLLRAVVARWGLGFVERGTSDVRWRHPVYEGDQLEIRVDPNGSTETAMVVEGLAEDGTVSATVVAGLPARAALAPPATELPSAAGRDVLILGPGERLEPGTAFADTEITLSASELDTYAEEIDDDDDLFRSRDSGGQGVVHPAFLHRLTSSMLFRSVQFDTAFQVAVSGVARHFAALRAGDVVTQRTSVADAWNEHGHEYVKTRSAFIRDGLVVAVVERSSIYRLARHAEVGHK